MISPANARPVITCVQDGVLGSFLLSREFALYEPLDARMILASAGVYGAPVTELLKRAGDKRIRGRDIWSAVLQAAPLNYSANASLKNGAYENWIPLRPTETRVNIRHGVLEQGVLDKKALGGGSKGLPALMAQTYGTQAALDFVDRAQRIAIGALDRSGVSIGIGDLIVPHRYQLAVGAAAANVVAASRGVGDLLRANGVVPPIGQTVRQQYEALQQNALRTPDDIIANVVGGLAHDSNAFLAMIGSASKGKVSNIVNVMGAIGQVYINGVRPAEVLGGRTFPYTPRYTFDPKARGFITDSYISEVNPVSFFFDSMRGRFDLATKALTTASTGHAMRESVFSVQGVVVGNTLSVGHAGGRVHSLLYGGDGMETRRLLPVEFRTAAASDADLAAGFGYESLPASYRKIAGAAAAAAAAAHWEALLLDRSRYRALFGMSAAADRRRPFTTTRLAPVKVLQLVSDVLSGLEVAGGASGASGITGASGARGITGAAAPSEPTLRDPEGFAARLARLEAYLGDIPYLYQNEGRRAARVPYPKHLAAAAFLLQMQVRAELAPPVLARLSTPQLEYILAETSRRIRLGFASPGTAAGIIAAQLIGEPMTQYMLDSHHRSVEGGTSSTGLKQVSEVMGAVAIEKESSPSMLVRPTAAEISARGSEAAAAEALASRLEQVTLRQLASRYDLLYEEFGRPEYVDFAGDKAWIDDHLRHAPLLERPADVTRFCVRVALKPAALILKGISLEDLVLACEVAFGRRAVFLHSAGMNAVNDEDGGAPLDTRAVLRIYWRESAFGRGGRRVTPESVAADLMETLLDAPLRGVDRIVNARLDTYHRRWGAAPDGSYGELPPGVAVRVDGTNFLGVAQALGVDAATLETTSVGDTLRCLGIEAARGRIIEQFLAFIGDGAPDMRNLEVFANTMTETGGVTAIAKTGLVAREPTNVLAAMANAAPKRSIARAARAGITAPVETFSAAMMTGQLPRLGTLFFDVGVDAEAARAQKTAAQAVLDDFDEL